LHGSEVAAAPTAGQAFFDARQSASTNEKKFVGDQLIRFCLHLFDNNKEYLVDDHLEKMERFNTADENSRGHTRAGKLKANKRTQLRKYIRDSIKNIKPARGGASHDCPIKIDGDGAINYEIIRDYIETKASLVVVDRDNALAYMKEIGKPTLQLHLKWRLRMGKCVFKYTNKHQRHLQSVVQLGGCITWQG